MGRPKINEGPCSVDGCQVPAKCKGMCGPHYIRHLRSRGPVGSGEGKRDHPLYMIWWERKSRGSLCPEWAADFDRFIREVGDRPSPTHLLRTLRHDEPYSSTNFEWLGALRREDGESRRAFNARKWASRRDRFPEYEAHRALKRRYGITPEDYAAMLKAQDGKCAICRQRETALDYKTHAPKLLSVDHCHETKKVRGLLCFRCNTSIGKFEHDPELLRRAALFCERKLLIIIESDGS